MSNNDDLKKLAALRALELVAPGMRLGLGTGSTAKHFVAGLGEKCAGGLDVRCVPTSEETRQQAEGLNIPLANLDELEGLDLTVDGADEMDAGLSLIKGGGAALLREKIVAAASARMIVIADDSKLVERLGAFPLPVEVNPFAHETTAQMICNAISVNGLAGDVTLRGAENPFVTDGGHYIYDCALGQIDDATSLSEALLNIPGVVEHGLFLGLATGAVIATETGLEEFGEL